MSADTLTLADFLAARVAEDDASALMASGPRWTLCDRDDGYFFIAAESMAVASAARSEDRAHIARHDPSRALAECAAKREIIELHAADHECAEMGNGYAGVFAADGSMPHACPTMRALANVYADHSDYRQEWKP